MNRKIVTTKDGSSTLFWPEMDEHYHSIHGAIQESKHVFINAGFSHLIDRNKNESISILEIGFGTGLNALLTLLKANQNATQVNYHSIELYPLNSNEVESLNYSRVLNLKEEELTFFNQLHQSDWNVKEGVGSYFTLTKHLMDIQDVNFEHEFDLIYFDAFAPSSQPHLWTIDIFEKMYRALKEDGIFVTYCAKGQVKRDLKTVGFKIEALQGPPGKREMTRACK